MHSTSVGGQGQWCNGGRLPHSVSVGSSLAPSQPPLHTVVEQQYSTDINATTVNTGYTTAGGYTTTGNTGYTTTVNTGYTTTGNTGYTTTGNTSNTSSANIGHATPASIDYTSSTNTNSTTGYSTANSTYTTVTNCGYTSAISIGHATTANNNFTSYVNTANPSYNLSASTGTTACIEYAEQASSCSEDAMTQSITSLPSDDFIDCADATDEFTRVCSAKCGFFCAGWLCSVCIAVFYQ